MSFDDNAPDSSTAPTTPDCSLNFSPVLLPSQLQDVLEDVIVGRSTLRQSRAILDTHPKSGAALKNICCIGAGYVGMCYPVAGDCHRQDL